MSQVETSTKPQKISEILQYQIYFIILKTLKYFYKRLFMKIVQILLILLFTSNLFSQREYYNWYFGDSIAMTFNTPDLEPKFLDDSKNRSTIWGYPISMSDKYGNLLLTSDNDTFKDYNHDVLYLFKAFNQNQYRENKLIQFCIKKPKSEHLYYIFMLSSSYNYFGSNRDTLIGLYYWVYDSKLNDFAEKNVLLVDSLFGNFDITSHKNGIDFWIIAKHKTSSDIHSYLITKDGLNKTPVINKNSLPPLVMTLDVRVSPNSKKLAITFVSENEYKGYTYLADFDNETGIISNQAILQKEIKDEFYIISHSCEFSSNSKNLYFTYNAILSSGVYVNSHNSIVQYHLSNENNQFNLDSNSNYLNHLDNSFFQDLELGPNNKIYLNNITSHNLYSINNPNESFNKIEFELVKHKYNSNRSRLPKTLNCRYSFLNINHFQEMCENEDIVLKAIPFSSISSASFTWEGPNGFYSEEESPIIKNILIADEGYYKVKVYNESDTLSDSTLVTVNERTDFELIKSKETLCPNDSLVLYTKENFNILWNNNITSKSFTVYNSGTYTALNIDGNKCETIKSIYIEEYDLFPKITTTQNNFCYGDSATLSLDMNYDSIIWNTGENTKDIIVKESGVYSATVTQGECTNDTSIVINVNPLPTLDIESPNGTILCDGGSIEINIIVQANTKIEWNDGISLESRTFNQSGTYTITAEDLTTGCKNTKSIVISDFENLKAEIQGDPTFCDGESTTLTIQPQGKSYLWNNGETTQSIVVNQSGLYSATITTDTDCKIDAEIEVIKNPLPTFQILGETIICNNTTTIYPDNDFKYYKWSNGETSKSITIDKAGNYDLAVTDENGCKATQSIEITESTPEINLSNRNIDFGELLFGSTKSEDIATDKEIIIIKNSSIFDINYSNKNINISFNPIDIGQFIDTLIIESTGDCKALDTIYLTGICKAEILAKVSNSEAYPGDIVNNRVNLELMQNIPLPKDFNYEIDIQINQDAIQIQDATTFNYKNNKLEIYIADYLNKISYDEKIKEINSKIMLTKNLENELIITKFETDNPYLIPIRQNGNIKIYEICLYEERLIELYNEAIINEISKTKTTLTTYYAGKYEITISDLTGKTLYQKTETTTDDEIIDFNYNLSNGTYIIKINEPGKTQTRKIVFVE